MTLPGSAGSPINISTRGSMALRCCFWRLFASLFIWFACQRRAQRPRLTTPLLPPRPSRRNNCIGPLAEGATSLAGPLATLTKLQWLELRYAPLATCGGVALGGQVAERTGNADGLGAREGGNTLRFATSIPPLCRQQTASFPTPPPPLAMTAGAPPAAGATPSAPAARRPWRRRSLGWTACRT